MRKIEEFSELEMKEMIFDSKKNNWEENTSEFDSLIMNREKLIVLIEDNENNKFGCFIESKIDKLDEKISDSKSFIFSLKSNERLKEIKQFKLKEDKINESFTVYKKENKKLIEIGKEEIVII